MILDIRQVDASGLVFQQKRSAIDVMPFPTVSVKSSDNKKRSAIDVMPFPTVSVKSSDDLRASSC